MDVITGFAPAVGTELYYEVAGSGPPVVLLHPGQGGLILWDTQFEEFARSHRVVRYDARGFGRSEKPLHPFTFYDDLRAILDALGIARAALVGVSLGGRTSLDFAVSDPDRVAGLVLVNPGVSGYQFTGLDGYVAQIDAATKRGDVDALVEIQMRMWFDGPSRTTAQVDREMRRFSEVVLREQIERNRGRLARLGSAADFAEIGAAARLGEIRAPALIVESTLDQPDIHAICDLLAVGIAGAKRVTIEGAAHLVSLEKPKEFAAAVLPFLAAHPGA